MFADMHGCWKHWLLMHLKAGGEGGGSTHFKVGGGKMLSVAQKVHWGVWQSRAHPS